MVRGAAGRKHIEFDLDKLMRIDKRRLEILARVEQMRARQNEASGEVAQVPDEASRGRLISEMQVLKRELQKEEEKLADVMRDWQALMLQVPNVPDVTVPEGEHAADNQEVRRWGQPPKFGFKPKNHVELMLQHNLADFERGAKVSGFRGYFLKNDLVRLSFALWRYALDKMMAKGFTPMIVPSLVKRDNLLGTGYLPHGDEDLYHTQDNDYLGGTGEVATMGYFADEVIARDKLPIKVAAFSPCFRREAGAHGKDTKGLIRVHEFYKVEQLILCEASHELSVELHEELTRNAEEILQALGLHYRLMALCGAELGRPHVKTYDIETWLPSEGRYLETHSSSYYHDFQARRLGIKYKDEGGKLKYAYSLNNTVIATPRILAAILENYQQADGAVFVPEALRDYVGGQDQIKGTA